VCYAQPLPLLLALTAWYGLQKVYGVLVFFLLQGAQVLRWCMFHMHALLRLTRYVCLQVCPLLLILLVLLLLEVAAPPQLAQVRRFLVRTA
jgi:hypothetical protein